MVSSDLYEQSPAYPNITENILASTVLLFQDHCGQYTANFNDISLYSILNKNYDANKRNFYLIFITG